MRQFQVATLFVFVLLCPHMDPLLSPSLNETTEIMETGSILVDTDQDGFNDVQDKCIASLQAWVDSPLMLIQNHTHFDFKMDRQDRGHFAFHDPASDTLRYGLYDNGSLTTTLIDEGNQSGLFLSIVLNSTDQPTIVYSIGKYGPNNRFAVGIADWNGTDWNKTKLEEYYTPPNALMSGYWNLRVTAHYGLNDELFVASITDRNAFSAGGWLNLISRNNTGDWNNIFTAYSQAWERTEMLSPIHITGANGDDAKTFDVTTNSTGFPFSGPAAHMKFPSLFASEPAV